MSITRHLLLANGVLLAGATSYFGYWIQKKAHSLPEDQQGALRQRVVETAHAVIDSMQIQDRQVAKKHIETVVTLSSKKAVQISENEEADKVKTLFIPGYFQDILQKQVEAPNFVFHYTENLTHPLPSNQKETFSFVGSTIHLKSLEARESISKLNYVWCKNLVSVKTDASHDYQTKDVLITGTTKCRICDKLAKEILRDKAKVSSGAVQNQILDEQDPLSDTPVIMYSQKKYSEVGDLITAPTLAKSEITQDNFTTCNFYAYRKTRFSPTSPKIQGAIIAGTSNNQACLDAYLAYKKIEKIIDQTDR